MTLIDLLASDTVTMEDRELTVAENNITIFAQLKVNWKYHAMIVAANSAGEAMSSSPLSKKSVILCCR